MKKFKCTVTRVDEYEIEIDETVINTEWMDDFKKHFYKIDDLEGHAEHIAQMRARTGPTDFIEGYGHVRINGHQYRHDTDKHIESGINISVISEDHDCEVEVEEIK